MRVVKGKKSDVIIRKYPDQNYSVYFNKSSGFFMRIEDKESEEPFYSKTGPELLDIAITNWCDRYCEYCYRDSNKFGKHILLEDYDKIIKQASSLGVLQVALGGGNPNQHPNFTEILKITREKYGIIPSYTTNGIGLSKEVLSSTKEYCGAVAVSHYSPIVDMVNAIKVLIDYGIKTNIHFVLERNSIDIAIDWLINFPIFLKNVNALIFLNYKPIGRFLGAPPLLYKSDKIEKFFSLISHRRFPFKVGFDSCLVPGIVSYMDFNSKYIEACDAGRFSAFISEDLKMYPCSFMVNLIEGEDLSQETIKNVWENSPCFVNIRQSLKRNNCKDKCEYFNICLGGCPVFKDINICRKFLKRSLKS